MKSTGIVRKIDDLGRIVIPKEIRKSLNIANNDDIEIFIEDNNIILKKYSYLYNYKEESNKLLSDLNGLVDAIIYITDKDKIISHGELENKMLPISIRKIFSERKTYISNSIEDFLTVRGYYIINPIIKDSNIFGSIIFIKNSPILKDDILFTSILKKLIENR